MRMVDTGAVQLHTTDLGAGPALVMVHGLLVGSLASWYLTAAPALARTHAVRLYDLRGHGRSTRPPTGYDTRTMAGDLAALAADLPGPIDVVGHSYGALVALRFAQAHPTRVRRLSLVEAPLPPSPPLPPLLPDPTRTTTFDPVAGAPAASRISAHATSSAVAALRIRAPSGSTASGTASAARISAVVRRSIMASPGRRRRRRWPWVHHG